MYTFLDYFFLIFHNLLICFNLFGWIWKKTRLANLITLGLTAFSWFVLGIFYGIGFCPLTEWHWRVLHHLGKYNLPNSYTKYVFDRVTGLNADPHLADILTATFCFLAIFCAFYVNFKEKRSFILNRITK